MTVISPSPEAIGGTARREAIARALPSALDAHGQFRLVYQPILDLPTRACFGVEALLRWSHPQLGQVPPLDFVPVAEDCGAIARLTARAMDLAFGDLRAAARQGFDLMVFVNVSARLLATDDFPTDLSAAIDRHGLAPGRVALEFTESTPLPDTPSARERLHRLAAQGFTLAIDDFGAGHNGLVLLRDAFANILKIDRCFVRDLADNPRDRHIVRAVLSLARALGCRVVAEGVETAPALDLLESWGCDAAQGYFICRPVPLPELLIWLARERTS